MTLFLQHSRIMQVTAVCHERGRDTGDILRDGVRKDMGGSQAQKWIVS